MGVQRARMKGKELLVRTRFHILGRHMLDLVGCHLAEFSHGGDLVWLELRHCSVTDAVILSVSFQAGRCSL